MYFQRLKNVMHCRQLTWADVARAAGVSRAAITKWHRSGTATGWINLETSTLRTLADRLQMPAAYFLTPQEHLTPLHTRFLWDALYPSMEALITAIRHHAPEALARLVHVLGFHDALAIAGRSMIDRFPQYKRYILPVRRHELEVLWPLYRAHQ